MRKVLFIEVAILLCEILDAQGAPSPILKDLRAHGGIAVFELTVKDDQGKPVEGAEGCATFWAPFGKSRDSEISDKNGFIHLSGDAWMDGNYSIKKEGYYETTGKAIFVAPSQPFGFLEQRRWVPVVREVTLKRKRNPIPMFAHGNIKLPIVQTNEPFALDLALGDWVVPYGNGKQADVWVTVTTTVQRMSSTRQKISKSLVLDFRNNGDGAYFCKKDDWSELMSSYQVATNRVFTQTIMLSCDEQGFTQKPYDYFVIRIRSRNIENRQISANYAKLYGPVWVRNDEIWIPSIYFNPIRDDTNLEFDLERNLAPKTKKERAKVFRP